MLNNIWDKLTVVWEKNEEKGSYISAITFVDFPGESISEDAYLSIHDTWVRLSKPQDRFVSTLYAMLVEAYVCKDPFAGNEFMEEL